MTLLCSFGSERHQNEVIKGLNARIMWGVLGDSTKLLH